MRLPLTMATLNPPLMSRRQFLESSAASISIAAVGSGIPFRLCASTNAVDVIAGAIRWDAWYKNADVSMAAQNSLSSDRYYRRAPFFCSVTPGPEVTCIGSPAEMDEEIHMAVKGGLKYWAFDWVRPGSSLRTAWDLYSKSSFRNLINWCGLAGVEWFGSVPFSDNKWQATLQEWLNYMTEPNYQKITVGEKFRPLLYINWDQNQLKYHFENKVSNVRISLDYLRRSLTDRGLSTPYVVLLIGPEKASIARDIGADAIGGYISRFGLETKGPYVDLDKQTREYWEEDDRYGCADGAHCNGWIGHPGTARKTSPMAGCHASFQSDRLLCVSDTQGSGSAHASRCRLHP